MCNRQYAEEAMARKELNEKQRQGMPSGGKQAGAAKPQRREFGGEDLDRVDQGSWESFPASDPPATSAAGADEPEERPKAPKAKPKQ